MSAILDVAGLAVSYGPVRAVRGLDLKVHTGEIVALIGANGAGKTTTVKAIAGLLPFTGTIAYDGRALTPNRAERNAGRGLVLVRRGGEFCAHDGGRKPDHGLLCAGQA